MLQARSSPSASSTAPLSGLGLLKSDQSRAPLRESPPLTTCEPFERYVLGRPYLDQYPSIFIKARRRLLRRLKRERSMPQAASHPCLVGAAPRQYPSRALPAQSRIWSLFQSKSIRGFARQRCTRGAFNIAVDRGALVCNVLAGYGTPLTEPVPAKSPCKTLFWKTVQGVWRSKRVSTLSAGWVA